jgi:hypothetical protein
MLSYKQYLFEQNLSDTIVVDGIIRSTKNSLNKPIATDNTSIENFWRWFGNSKLVDHQHRPLVVYHGTEGDFDTFEQSLIGVSSNNKGFYGRGFYFSIDHVEAQTYGSFVMPVYLKMDKPFINSTNDIDVIAYEFGYNKEPVSINKTWLLNQIKLKDTNAAILANLLVDGVNEDDLWDEFGAAGGSYSDELIDLNDVVDWFDDSKFSRNMVSSIEQSLSIIIPEYAFVYGYGARSPSIVDFTAYGQDSKPFTDSIIKRGYDGVIANGEYIVFSSDQIKSAIGNSGKFSSTSKKITERTI